MARQLRTPSTPAKRSKKTSGQNSPAAVAGPVVQEPTPETPSAPPEPRPAPTEASAGRMLDAAKTLIEAIAEGMDTLLALRVEVREIGGRLDQLLASMANGARTADVGSSAEAGDYQPGRDRDPGDAVPPGVAVMSPTPLTETDEVVLHKLEDLPKRGRRGKSGPRAKS